MRRLWPFALVVLVGCSGGLPKETKKKLPENFSGVIDYRNATRQDHRGTWQASGFQPDGEEKIIFSQTIRPVKPPVLSPAELIVDGPAEDVETVRSMLWHLRSEVRRNHFPIREYGMAPFGTSNSLYFGHTFWDMDVWMLPAVVLLEPQAVRDMAMYRLNRLPEAKKRYRAYLAKTGKTQPSEGAQFPWESSISGKEVVAGDSIDEHHVSGSVLWGLKQAEKWGLADPRKVAEVQKLVANFYEARSESTTRGWEILNVMSPDELHKGDNDLYTNLIAQWSRNGCQWAGNVSYFLPKDEQTFLSFERDHLIVYKQAAAVLSVFPLQYPAAEAQAEKLVSRFEDKIVKNGIAMSDAIHATIWARGGNQERAYKAWQKSWKPFIREGLFSEKVRPVRTYFYTGAAGAINTVIYGFAGIRLDDRAPANAAAIIRLKSGAILSFKPCLPASWRSIQLKNVQIDGQTYTISIYPKQVTIRKI
jgi:trehalose/maltose hydrolase-like predicted phosphorylase